MNNIASLIILLIPVVSLASGGSPYAGEDLRQIKSLSEREVTSLSRGDGMGFAKLAELNHYPGPRHVLEISDELGLSPSQIAETESLFEEMRLSAVALGKKLLAAESDLDREFENQLVSPQALKTALLEIGRLRAELRYIHLEVHLRQQQLLSPEQVSKYDAVRGYHGAAHEHDQRPNTHE